ncbi:hypothetical protein [Desulfurobacterium atlanticum]|uniref:Diheme cytochrome c NapB n=1 Tax=Desulfurobacterium atlanticum TaxID=240169 RepID=A0A239A7M9_9BACT|nr:hypothetical protein [Desulfurobacterium atlanticum]SNR91570.1 hypothetical protein SAMN06265340_11616 [Desulfurobacterium atlanticum]
MRKVLFLSLLAGFVVSCAGSKTEPVKTQPQPEKKVEKVEKKEEEQGKQPEKVEEIKKVAPSVEVPESKLVLSKFKHSDHVKVIREYGCIPCHHFNVEMHVPDVNRAHQVSQKFLKPSEASCKVCHTKGVE